MIDCITPLFERFRVTAHMFHTGPLCGVTPHDPGLGLGYLHLLRAGEMTVEHPRTRGGPPEFMTLQQPTLLLYPRPMDHVFHTPARQGSELVCAALRFQGGAGHPLAQALPPLIVLPLADMPTLHSTLELLFSEANPALAGHQLLADRLMEVLLIQLMRWLLSQPERYPMPIGLLAGLGDVHLSKALTAMHSQPAHPWQLPEMAKHAGMSRSAFVPAFKRVLGQTPAEYLARWRLALAQERLARGQPIARVASEVGYGSASALSRAFSARLAQSPRAWRQALATQQR